MAARILLGPQRPTVNFGDALQRLTDDGPIAVVSAGAQEAEGDNRDLESIVDRPLIDLQLYQRAEVVLAAGEPLHDLYRQRQDRLQELQRLYRLRLRQSMLAARHLLRAEGEQKLLQHEQRHAISQQRALDRHQLQRIRAINNEYDGRVAAERSPVLAQHISELSDILAPCQTVVIFGGNVAILLNRLRLFNIATALANKNIVACSAGAMVLANKVVLFHDRSPEGARDAEVLGSGLGIVGDLVLLPDATNRLRLRDTIRTALFCRRFAPSPCMTLDSGALLHYEDGRIVAASGAQRLTRSGGLRAVRAA